MKIIRKLRKAGLALCCVLIAMPAPALAGPAEDLSSLRQQVDALKEREADALRRVEALEKRLEMLEQSRLSDAEQAGMMGRGATSGLGAVRYGDQVAVVQEDTGAGGGDDRKAPAPTVAQEDVALQQQGISNSRFGLELGMTYSHFDNARINLNGFLALDSIFLGKISIDQLRADVLTADLTGRFAPNDRLQLDVNVPYLYRHSNFQSGGAGGAATSLSEKSVSDHGLGDISFGASYRILKETQRRPDLVLAARVKAPTGRHPFGVELIEVPGTEGNLAVPDRLAMGSGVWGASIGASVLKTIDPMVVFGSLTYFHNFPRAFDDIDEAEGDQPGKVRIGNAIQYGAGVAFALNDRSSLSFSFSQRLIARTKVRRDGEDFQTIIGSQGNVGLVNIGGTFALTQRLSLISTVGIGLTQDAPNMVVGLRAPFRF